MKLSAPREVQIQKKRKNGMVCGIQINIQRPILDLSFTSIGYRDRSDIRVSRERLAGLWDSPTLGPGPLT